MIAHAPSSAAHPQLTAFPSFTKMSSPPFLPFVLGLLFRSVSCPLYCYNFVGLSLHMWWHLLAPGSGEFNRWAIQLPPQGSMDVINVVYEKARNT